MSQVELFNKERKRLNDIIMSYDNKVMKRLFSLDNQAYEKGALNVATKEMLGLVASLVLRCDDCIKYHLGTCFDQGVSDEEMMEVLSIGNIVGGSICIPHTRRALEYWEELKKNK